MTFQKIVDYIKKKQKNLKILVMGLDNAGKTAIINSYFKLRLDSAPTFGYKIHSILYKDYKLNIVDIGGQYCFREYWSNYFERTDGILFIIDCTDVGTAVSI
ncbi:small GTP-binding protein domain protein [Vittaforma corneae ATCC 50505]|uniref:Small GTP-binding protein domain protein n=1 Tax=Vittaforma corneae (strain ATCC 50505) TaxID=993615 RepID=L2GLH8_VITCO|nr:small GTP-binding protein domain protein [Vittaforma corneae ATCC 50505]ELA41701.1 small GTP-binding protein domain protein [Vittaforma corneae ATCC 50505]